MPIVIPRKNSPDSCFEILWLDCMCKPRLGRGTTRDVYEIPGENKVLKVSNVPSNLTNWREVLVYDLMKNSGELAEIFSWSWSGKFVVMEKLISVPQDYNMGTHKYPDFLTDRKRENYGQDSHGKIKALDYASVNVIQKSESDFQ